MIKDIIYWLLYATSIWASISGAAVIGGILVKFKLPIRVTEFIIAAWTSSFILFAAVIFGYMLDHYGVI